MYQASPFHATYTWTIKYPQVRLQRIFATYSAIFLLYCTCIPTVSTSYRYYDRTSPVCLRQTPLQSVSYYNVDYFLSLLDLSVIGALSERLTKYHVQAFVHAQTSKPTTSIRGELLESDRTRAQVVACNATCPRIPPRQLDSPDRTVFFWSHIPSQSTPYAKSLNGTASNAFIFPNSVLEAHTLR